MGESIAEGTITRWMKQIGDTVARDEPLFEISTDKVDAEIPSPAAGRLIEIKNATGETVPVNQVVAVLETDASAAVSAAPAKADAPAPVEAPPQAAPAPAAPAPAAPAPAAKPAAPEPAAPRGEGAFVSPVVRKIAEEHGLDPERVPGTGAGGRVTKKENDHDDSPAGDCAGACNLDVQRRPPGFRRNPAAGRVRHLCRAVRDLARAVRRNALNHDSKRCRRFLVS